MNRDQITNNSYENISKTFSEKHHDASLMFNFFTKYLTADYSSGTCLDIGCGTGRDAMELSRIFQKVYCLDYAENMLNCIPHNTNIVKLHENVLSCAYKFSDLSVVWMNAVIHHISPQDRKILLCNIANWLKPSGGLFLSFRVDIQNKYDSEYANNPRYYYRINQDEIKSLLHDSGFKSILFEETSAPKSLKRWFFSYSVTINNSEGT
jgi:SAM-dependent methyltransferase